MIDAPRHKLYGGDDPLPIVLQGGRSSAYAFKTGSMIAFSG
jgi:hypothetical protein